MSAFSGFIVPSFLKGVRSGEKYGLLFESCPINLSVP